MWESLVRLLDLVSFYEIYFLLENLEERFVKTSTGKKFIYETGDRRYDCSRKRNYSRRLDDTRSLYDDPKL